MANHFCALPQELQIEILAHLDAISLICCAMTCKAIHASFKSSSLLSYTIQLHLDGLKDAGTSHNHSVLLESLARRRQAWLALEIDEPLVRQTQSDFTTFEFAVGAFATTSRNDFEIIWLPTASRMEGRTLRHPAIEMAAARLVMDPTQDLVAFLERDDGQVIDLYNPAAVDANYAISIHLRTISTYAIHPQARQSPMQLILPGDIYEFAMTDVIPQIAYNMLAVYFRNASREARVIIWDWTTSDLILDTARSFDPLLPSLQFHFGLLDATYFFVACEANAGSLRLYQLPSSRSIAAPETHLATLHLPPTLPDITIHEIVSQAGPVEAHPLPHTPFAVHDAHRLHMFTVQYTHATEERSQRVRYINVFVHQHALLKYARRACTAHAALDIPWVEWGPPNTRVVLSSFEELISRWRRYIHGQRAVFAQRLNRLGTMEPFRDVDVFDFSLAAVLSAQGILNGLSTGKHGRLLSSSTIRATDGPPLFLADVKTHLPCVVSTLHLKHSYSSLMIYADGIFGLDIDEDADCSIVLRIYPV